MRFGILGSLTVWQDDREIALGGPRQRALLAALLLRPNELAPTARLVDELWGERPPPTAVKTVQVWVSQLRKALGRKAIETHAAGYLLRLDPGALDARRFEDLLERGRRVLAEGSPSEAAGVLREALALWRGPALADFEDAPFARDAIGRLEELRVVALEQRLTADLALGRHAEAVPELEALVREHPLREGLRGLLMLALYRSGRQADALAAYQEARRELVDELGLDPGQSLQQLEKAILVQDPGLELPASREAARPRPAAAPTAACVRCGRANDAGARFCQFCGAPVDREERAEARKTVTVLACALGAPAARDPEALRRAQLAAFEAAAAVVARHGGTVEPFAGDAVTAVFGVPYVREDDALRAVRAAKELLDTPLGLDLRAGLDTGEVVAGGGPVTGAPVSEAARLARAADPGEIRLAGRTHELVAHAVRGEARDGGSFALGEVEAGAPAFPRRDRTPLVGRARELAELEERFAEAEAGGARHVTIVGEAGIGKSRLVRELLARLGRRATARLGSCPPYGEGVTFAPLASLLPGAALDAPSHEVFAAARRSLEELARERPVVAAFEDLHWAEPTFLDLVEYLAGRLGEARVLLLCLARPELGARRPAWLRGALALEPLSREESEELVAELGVGDEARAAIAETAEGNPLFAEQLAAVADRSATLPASIRGVLSERIDRLGRDERAVLERAAVVGRAFTLPAVVALSPGESAEHVEARLFELARQGLLRPDQAAADEGFRFQHALLRDAAYEGMPKASRAALHERAAGWLEQADADDALVGHHLEQAVRFLEELGTADRDRGELAARAGRRLAFAGGRALARGDVPAAASLLERAAALLAADDARAAVLTELGSVQMRAGDFAAAAETLARARAAATDLGDRRSDLRAAVEQQFLASFTGPAEARDVAAADRLLPDLEAIGDDLGLAKAWWLRSEGDAIACRWQARADALERALAYARRAPDVRDEAGTITALLAQALYFGPTPAGDAVARCEELLAEAGGDRPLRAALASTLGGLLAMRGEVERGRALYGDAMAIYDELGLRFRRAARAHIGAQIALRAGDPGEAERELREALATLEEIGAAGVHTTLAAVLADMLAGLGRDVDAEALLRDLEEAAAPDDLAPQVLRRTALARVLARSGAKEEARALAHAALELTGAVDFPELRARALLAAAEVLGDPELLAAARAVYEAKGDVAAAGALLASPATPE